MTKIIRRIGQGSFGTVFLVHSQDRLYAIKKVQTYVGRLTFHLTVMIAVRRWRKSGRKYNS